MLLYFLKVTARDVTQNCVICYRLTFKKFCRLELMLFLKIEEKKVKLHPRSSKKMHIFYLTWISVFVIATCLLKVCTAMLNVCEWEVPLMQCLNEIKHACEISVFG